MFILEILISTMAFLASLILLIILSLAQKAELSENKLAPFECGFLPHTSHRLSFSLHFFLIGILFVVFDVELVLLFPYIVTFLWKPLLFKIFWALLVILLLGLLVEWLQLMLDWSNFK